MSANLGSFLSGTQAVVVTSSALLLLTFVLAGSAKGSFQKKSPTVASGKTLIGISRGNLFSILLKISVNCKA